jgi:hypothetical protein
MSARYQSPFWDVLFSLKYIGFGYMAAIAFTCATLQGGLRKKCGNHDRGSSLIECKLSVGFCDVSFLVKPLGSAHGAGGSF